MASTSDAENGPDDRSAAGGEPSAEPAPAQKRTIFMVDDDSYLVEVARCVFEAEGYAFASAHSANEALAIIDGINPDLIIADVMMEDVLAGFRLVNTLRQDPERKARYAHVPIVMFTSIEQRTKMRFSVDLTNRSLPIDAFLEKPVQIKVLIETVSQVLAKRRPLLGNPPHGA